MLWVNARIARCGRRRATAEAVRPVKVGNEDRARRKRLGDVAGGVGHRLVDRRLVARLRGVVPVAEMRLDRAAQCDRSRQRPRQGAGRPLSRPEHDRRGAVEEGVARSDASARVGSGAWIIDSSIWVAVITGVARSSARWMIRFWRGGTSRGRARRRDRRARPSRRRPLEDRLKRATACGRSIFAITADATRAPRSACAARVTSAGDRTNDRAT